MQRVQSDGPHLYEECIGDTSIRNDAKSGPSTATGSHSPVDTTDCDIPTREQNREKTLIKFAVILGFLLLTTSLAITIALHFQQQSEWKQAHAEISTQLKKNAFDIAMFKNINQAQFRFSAELEEIAADVAMLKNIIQDLDAMQAPRETETYSSCRDVNVTSANSLNETGGVFNIEIPGVGTKEVYCNTEIDGGGWIVFQRRIDGSVEFNLNWTEYVAGFGNASGEYWLGLEAIHQLTKNGSVEMRVDMIRLDGNYYYAKYSNFKLGPALDNYRLTVGGHSGNVSDRLEYSNNEQFSTKDRDNDRSPDRQCARSFNGAWWYNACAFSSLNGVYGRTNYRGIYWVGALNNNNMRFSEMKLRKKMYQF